ncbi:MAG: DUF4350 domain-containing protein [Candidatus Nanopelagicales bacterium]
MSAAPSQPPSQEVAAPDSAPAGPDAPISDAPISDATLWDRVRRWRPSRHGVLLGLLLALALGVLAVTAPRSTGYLDPVAVDPTGSRAVARVLDDLGVDVLDVRTTAAAAADAQEASLLITDSTLPTESMLGQVLDAAPRRIVLVKPMPGMPAFDRFAAGIEVGSVGDEDPVDAGCQLPEARRSGPATLPGSRYDARAWSATGQACYDRSDAAAVVVLPAGPARPEVVLLGSDHLLTNAGFAEQGNAALALGLLGSRDRLVWWRPTASDPALADQGGTTLGELLPVWVLPVIVQLGIAWLVVIGWRARRLGRLVVEPLPVVIRAGETTAGHGRLLASRHARDEAALHLRARAREQVRVRLGLPPGVSPERVAAAAAHRSGRAPEDVHSLLYGPEPTTDAELVALNHDLGELITQMGGA